VKCSIGKHWRTYAEDGDTLFLDHIREIAITIPEDFLWEEIVTEMEEPFPALTSLYFNSFGEVVPLPDSFLNGSAPCLQQLNLSSLTRLLLSTSGLTFLRLVGIPDSGYIPPETVPLCVAKARIPSHPF
jgi:hypothetical protein